MLRWPRGGRDHLPISPPLVGRISGSASKPARRLGRRTDRRAQRQTDRQTGFTLLDGDVKIVVSVSKTTKAASSFLLLLLLRSSRRASQTKRLRDANNNFASAAAADELCCAGEFPAWEKKEGRARACAAGALFRSFLTLILGAVQTPKSSMTPANEHISTGIGKLSARYCSH